MVGAGLAATVLAGPVRAQTAEVDLALALAIDCSFSVDASEFRLQMRGLGEAIASDEVWQAIEKGPLQRVAMTVYQWSDKDFQRVTEPWAVIDSRAAAQGFGTRVARGARRIPEGGTAISSALIFGAALFEVAPPATRRVIDIATDGRNNMGGHETVARDTVVARGITINALAISNEVPTLDAYLELRVAGGPSNFVERAPSYDDFAAAMLRKIVKEVTGPGLT
ncbi:MAG: DUF1194 domain-containing protein [Hyphomicrobiales bacterium]